METAGSAGPAPQLSAATGPDLTESEGPMFAPLPPQPQDMLPLGDTSEADGADDAVELAAGDVSAAEAVDTVAVMTSMTLIQTDAVAAMTSETVAVVAQHSAMVAPMESSEGGANALAAAAEALAAPQPFARLPPAPSESRPAGDLEQLSMLPLSDDDDNNAETAGTGGTAAALLPNSQEHGSAVAGDVPEPATATRPSVRVAATDSAQAELSSGAAAVAENGESSPLSPDVLTLARRMLLTRKPPAAPAPAPVVPDSDAAEDETDDHHMQVGASRLAMTAEEQTMALGETNEAADMQDTAPFAAVASAGAAAAASSQVRQQEHDGKGDGEGDEYDEEKDRQAHHRLQDMDTSPVALGMLSPPGLLQRIPAASVKGQPAASSSGGAAASAARLPRSPVCSIGDSWSPRWFGKAGVSNAAAESGGDAAESFGNWLLEAGGGWAGGLIGPAALQPPQHSDSGASEAAAGDHTLIITPSPPPVPVIFTPSPPKATPSARHRRQQEVPADALLGSPADILSTQRHEASRDVPSATTLDVDEAEEESGSGGRSDAARSPPRKTRKTANETSVHRSRPRPAPKVTVDSAVSPTLAATGTSSATRSGSTGRRSRGTAIMESARQLLTARAGTTTPPRTRRKPPAATNLSKLFAAADEAEEEEDVAHAGSKRKAGGTLTRVSRAAADARSSSGVSGRGGGGSDGRGSSGCSDGRSILARILGSADSSESSTSIDPGRYSRAAAAVASAAKKQPAATTRSGTAHRRAKR